MRQLFLIPEFRFILAFILVGVCLFITIETAVRHVEDTEPQDDDNDNPFLNKEGNHIYYDRSLIEKEKFIRKNPEIPEAQLRTWRRFFRELLRR